MNVMRISESCGALDLIQVGDKKAMKLSQNPKIGEMKKEVKRPLFYKKG